MEANSVYYKHMHTIYIYIPVYIPVYNILRSVMFLIPNKYFFMGGKKKEHYLANPRPVKQRLTELSALLQCSFKKVFFNRIYTVCTTKRPSPPPPVLKSLPKSENIFFFFQFLFFCSKRAGDNEKMRRNERS